MVKFLPASFNFRERQSIFTTSEDIERAITVFESNTVIIARIKQIVSNTTSNPNGLAKKKLF